MDVERHPQAAASPSDPEYMKGFEVSKSIPAKYRGKHFGPLCMLNVSASCLTNLFPGTTADQRDMAMLGKKQVLRVRHQDNDLTMPCVLIKR